MTPEEAQMTGEANRLIENNLSSVKIARNSKGVTWEIKVKDEDPYVAARVAQIIDANLEEKYGTN